jgi:hypothetical protein
MINVWLCSLVCDPTITKEPKRTPIIVSLCDIQEHFSHSNTHPRACGIDPNGSFSQALEVDLDPLQF